jgi:hypothetical protein
MFKIFAVHHFKFIIALEKEGLLGEGMGLELLKARWDGVNKPRMYSYQPWTTQMNCVDSPEGEEGGLPDHIWAGGV